MTTKSKQRLIAVLPGDGIGEEVTEQSVRVIEKLNAAMDLAFECQHAPVGGTAYDLHGTPLPESTLELAQSADAILLGAVGGPKYDSAPRELRPERALLGLSSELDLFSNHRPAILFPELADASTLKPEVVAGLNIMIVRELTGGIYFGQPRAIEEVDGQRRGFNTMVYDESEIERIARSAFQTAMQRNRKLCSVDKANVLEVSELWREVVTRIGTKEFPDVELSHMYVDNACMQLVRAPKQFDVIVTTNMFGDILSDAASMLTGSIGMLPSASLDSNSKGMYEPVHGSAPDIAGQGIANPLASILSVAMMLRFTFGETKAAGAIELAVKAVLADGLRTGDIAGDGNAVSTAEMGQAVLDKIQ